MAEIEGSDQAVLEAIRGLAGRLGLTEIGETAAPAAAPVAAAIAAPVCEEKTEKTVSRKECKEPQRKVRGNEDGSAASAVLDLLGRFGPTSSGDVRKALADKHTESAIYSALHLLRKQGRVKAEHNDVGAMVQRLVR